MDEVPGFWRTEIWHPLSVHFPIALLLFATLSFVISLFMKEAKERVWSFMSLILLSAGVASAWIAIYTGSLADGIVSRKICDPTVLKDHELSAYTLSILFSVALPLLFLHYKNLFSKWKKILSIFIVLIMVTGCGFLAYAGHAGAHVVYQQGGGVYHPSEDCKEFE